MFINDLDNFRVKCNRYKDLCMIAGDNSIWYSFKTTRCRACLMGSPVLFMVFDSRIL